MLTRQEREKARRAAKHLWDQLDNRERGELGDALVLGTFDWRDYWDNPPPKGTISALDEIRMSEEF